jgi:hypothetical protein
MAAFAVVLRFLAVVGKGFVVAESRQLDRHRRRQRDAFVGRSKQHVEWQAGIDQAACVKPGELAQARAVIEEPRIEEVRRHSPGLGLETTESQYARIERKPQKVLCQGVGGVV